MQNPEASLLNRSTVEGLRRLDGGEGEVLRKTIELFFEMAPRNLTAAATALAEDDVETAQRMAHNLKAAAGTLGGETMMVLCAELERAAECGALREAVVLLQMVEVQFERLKTELVSEVEPGDS